MSLSREDTFKLLRYYSFSEQSYVNQDIAKSFSGFLPFLPVAPEFTDQNINDLQKMESFVAAVNAVVQNTYAKEDDEDDNKEPPKKKQKQTANTESSDTEEDDGALTLQLKEALVRMNEEASIRLNKQTCHICGCRTKMEDRIVCKNHFCALGGVAAKYFCQKCIKDQETYFKSINVDFKSVYGDVTSPNWYCPCCLVIHINNGKSNSVTLTGICCCSLRRINHFCTLHSTDGASKRLHCCPYRQKIGKKKQEIMKDLPLDLTKMKIGELPYIRYVGAPKKKQEEKSSSSSSSSSKAPVSNTPTEVKTIDDVNEFQRSLSMGWIQKRFASDA